MSCTSASATSALSLYSAIIQDARTFAQHFHRACARARVAERIRIENDPRGAAQVAGRDLLDEGGDVDVRGAGDRARRIVTVEALVRLEQRRVIRQRRRDVGGILRKLLLREWHRLLPAPCCPLPVSFRRYKRGRR